MASPSGHPSLVFGGIYSRRHRCRGVWFGTCFVMQNLVSFPALQSFRRGRESWWLNFNCELAVVWHEPRLDMRFTTMCDFTIDKSVDSDKPAQSPLSLETPNAVRSI